jgi:hypothetical protein
LPDVVCESTFQARVEIGREGWVWAVICGLGDEDYFSYISSEIVSLIQFVCL